MSDFSIGFHLGPSGNPTGIGSYEQQLHDAGIPFFIKSADHYGFCFEAANIARGSNVPHTIIFRLTTHGQNDGYDYDVPPYELPPAEAAAIHWDRTVAKLPPEFDKTMVWVEVINEVDRKRADWLGNFAAEIGTLAMNDGYKVTLFGWSSGEPEPADWQTPGMKRYLTMCAANPGKLAVSLHEYSYSQNIQNDTPNLVGRFVRLFEACAAMGIGRPTVHLTEWGWEQYDVPEPAEALIDIDWAYRLYAPYPEVKGASIWYLGSGFGDIHNQAQKLIGPVTYFMLNAPDVDPVEPPPIDPPPPDPEPTGRVVTTTTANVRRVPSTSGNTPIGTVPAGTEFEQVGESGNWYAVKVWVSKQVADPVDDETPPPTPVFRATAWPTPTLRTTQWFAANPQNYAQFGLPGHDGQDGRALTGEPIKALAAGTVYLAGTSNQSPNYGIQVRIDHGNGQKTAHAHLQQVSVSVGQQVTAGQVIGLADSTGNSTGSHWHGAYKRDGLTYTDPAGNVWPNNLFDPWLILEPLYNEYLATAGITGYLWAASTVKHPHFNWGFGSTNLNLRQGDNSNSPVLGLVQAGVPFKITGPKTAGGYYPAVALLGDLPPGTQPPPPGNAIDLVPYFTPANGQYGDIAILKNNWGQGDERQQLQREGDNLYVTKNSQYEKRVLRPSTIDLVLDTSPGNGQYYTVSGTWLPRQMAIGQSFRRTEQVTFYSKSNCAVAVPTYTNISDLKLVAKHAVYQPSDGIAVIDVVEMKWIKDGIVEETYWYGKGLGLIAWQNAAGKRSWIVERVPVGQQHNNQREVINCL